MMKVTLYLDYPNFKALHQSIWWSSHLERVVACFKCLAWKAEQEDEIA